jgi:transcriptional regulator with XRE-family HTH domain
MKKDEKVLKQIGDRLIKLRIKKGYKSYESFALDNEMSRMQYWRIEKGIANITMKSLLRILEVHDLTIAEFFSEGFE